MSLVHEEKINGTQVKVHLCTKYKISHNEHEFRKSIKTFERVDIEDKTVIFF